MVTFLEKYGILLSTSLLIACVLAVMSILGIGLSFDTNSYASYASEIIKHEFNIISFIDDHYPRLATYSVPIYVMGVIKYIFGETWKTYFLALNCICVTFMIWRFSSTLKKIGVLNGAIILCILLTIVSIDHIIWPRFVLTDTLYSAMILYAFTLPIHSKLTKTVNLLWFIVFLLLLMVTRPTALPVVLACITFAISYRSQFFLFKPSFSLPLLGLLVTLFTLVWAYFFYQYNLGYITPNKNLDYIYRFIENGAIITERADSTISISGAYSDYVLLYILRLIYFFSPYSAGFSLTHNLCNFIWLSSFFLSLIAAIKLNKQGLLTDQHKKIITGLIIMIIAVTCYHSAILIDYDWRYRYPLILPMLMIVAIVVSTLLKQTTVMRSK